MLKKKWTFLSNHGHVLVYVAEHPQSTTQHIAEKARLSIRAVQEILGDLAEEGYLTRERVGRSNRYGINLDKPLRHHLEKNRNVSDLLQALGIGVRGR